MRRLCACLFIYQVEESIDQRNLIGREKRPRYVELILYPFLLSKFSLREDHQESMELIPQSSAANRNLSPPSVHVAALSLNSSTTSTKYYTKSFPQFTPALCSPRSSKAMTMSHPRKYRFITRHREGLTRRAALGNILTLIRGFLRTSDKS